MKTTVLVSCVSRKREQKSKAQDRYYGPLFTKSPAYARSLKSDEIYIISAFRGLQQGHRMARLQEVLDGR